MISFQNTPFALKIRVTPDGRYASAFDVIREVLAIKNPRQNWAKLSSNLSTATTSTTTDAVISKHRFPRCGQHPTPTVSSNGMEQLLALMSQGKVAEFRKACNLNNGPEDVETSIVGLECVMQVPQSLPCQTSLGPQTNGIIPELGSPSGVPVNRAITFENTPFYGHHIRVTHDKLYASAFDVISAVSGNKNPREAWNTYSKELVEDGSTPMIFAHQFPGEGQRPTPTLTAQGVIELLFLIPGSRAQRFRKYCGAIVIRYLGGDQALVDEISRNERTAVNDKGSYQAFCAAAVPASKQVPSPFIATGFPDLEYEEKIRELDHKYKCMDDERHLSLLNKKEEHEKTLAAIRTEEISQRNELLSLSSKEYALKYQNRILHLKADGLKLVEDKKHVSPPPERSPLLPVFVVLLKNTPYCPDNCEHHKSESGCYKYYCIRVQSRSLSGALAKLKRGSCPEFTVILEAVYNPNPVAFFNRMEEKWGIRRFCNNFSIQGSYTLEEEAEMIRSTVAALSAFDPQQAINELDELAKDLVKW
jgi:Protein of unknown function (DUF3627)